MRKSAWLLGRRRGERQRMQFPAHPTFQGGVNDLVLLHPGFAAKRLGNHGRGVMVAIPCQILNLDLRVGQRFNDETLDVCGLHGHAVFLALMISPWPARP